MATVICKRSIMFRDEAQARMGLKTVRSHTIPANKDPQNIPDWVAEQSAFRHAVEHEEIMLLEVIKPAKAEVIEKKPLPENTAPADDSGTAPVQLETLTKTGLLEYARKLGIELDEKLKKDEILAAIKQETAKT